MSRFSETMKHQRYLRGMTQDEFARLLGTSKQNISRYESGAVSPKISTAQAIADKLGITLAELNGGEEPAGTQADRYDEEMWQLREEMRRTPELRTLFDAARGATPEDLRRAIGIIEALKKESGNV